MKSPLRIRHALILAILMLVMSLLSTAPVLAQGTSLGHFDVKAFADKPVYWPIGVTFNGKNLWYSQPSTASPDLFLVTPTGKLVRTLSITLPNTKGAIAWDGTDLWIASFAGESGSVTPQPFVFQVSTAGSGTLLKSLNLTAIFDVDQECGVIDGLAFDPSTGTLWVSPDVGCNFFASNICSIGFAYNIDTNGNLIRKIQFPFGVSGVAVANGNLYVADRCEPTSPTRGFGLIDKVDASGNVVSSFPIAQLDPKSWVEAIAFDPTTFGTCSIWAMQPYPVGRFTTQGSFEHADVAAYGIPCS
ncbi:hypothetical protein E6H13_07705 [Candidatus Bathyarchaeota archaeon]|nr:MAG: hypothetical protein E6H13_07705 [Candidatus Bathyarchaeota archaeon]